MTEATKFAATTAEQFRAAGVRFEASPVLGYRVIAPVGADELVERIRAEVKRRIPSMASMPLGAPQHGVCDGCWDQLPHYRGGMCELCVIARVKANEARGNGEAV